MSNHLNPEKRIKRQLVKYGKRIAQAGFVIGSGGNISLRYKNLVFLKARGVDMSQAQEDDYVFIDLKKGVAKNKSCILSSEYRMHILCYRVRPDIGAVIHVHPVFCVAVSGKIKILESQEYEYSVYARGSTRVIPYLKPGSLALAKAISSAIKKEEAVILRNHGLVCVGRSLEEAYIRCQAIERASLIYILRGVIRGNRF